MLESVKLDSCEATTHQLYGSRMKKEGPAERQKPGPGNWTCKKDARFGDPRGAGVQSRVECVRRGPDRSAAQLFPIAHWQEANHGARRNRSNLVAAFA